MVPAVERLDLLKSLVALLYERPFDRDLVNEVAAGACRLLDSQYLSLSLFVGGRDQKPLVISNNPPDYLPVYFSVARQDFLRNWVASTHREFVLRRMPGLHDEKNRTFTRTVQAARPVSDIAYLPITSGSTLHGFWSLARAGLGRPVYTDVELQTLRFLVAFLNDALQRSLLPPAPDDDVAYLDADARVLSAGACITEAFSRVFGKAGFTSGGTPAARSFRRAYRAFLGSALHPGKDRVSFRCDTTTYHFVFQRRSTLGHEWVSSGAPVAAVRVIGCPPSSREDEAGRWSAEFGLTPREIEVVDGILNGWSNKAIALNLGIDESTVKRHSHNIYEKTQFHSRVELVLAFAPRRPQLKL